MMLLTPAKLHSNRISIEIDKDFIGKADCQVKNKYLI